ncbi:hypothetical protein [Lentibacillus salinarum]|uniref:Uncharacterized protein n=1 Tax=Lentibacillus salinarum TaxID=446820 RepID=A0ABW3ZPT4_9BACI
MGYLLPVTQYQYRDYQKRTVKAQQDPFHIEKPYRTIMEANYHSRALNEAAVRTNTRRGVGLTGVKRPDPETIYAEVTGTGRHFSSSV